MPETTPASGVLAGERGLTASLGWTFSRLGESCLDYVRTFYGLIAFALITLSVAISSAGKARAVIRPLIRENIVRAGLRLLPLVSILGVALGLVVIGQTVALLSRVGAQEFAGTVMVTVVVRELGPLVASLIVLARVGTAFVIELGTARALGEVEAVEALAIDPIHYFVIPRVAGLALSVFALTVYFILITLASGYLFAFLQDVPLTPGRYLGQLAGALTWQDFVILVLKTTCFGAVLATVTCYEGLARRLRLDDVAGATSRAVVTSVVACVGLDALFLVVYLTL